jgi:PAS domain S-box-containing protein
VSETAGPNGHSETILVVEDDHALLPLIEKNLARQGYSIVGVRDGASALSWLETHRAALMLLDYSLPDMAGQELLKSLTDHGARTPFIVATGHGSETVAVEMMKHGARDYLVKDNYFLELLPTVVSQVLGQLENERKLAEAETNLRASEERFRQLADNVREVFWLATADKSEILYASPAYEEIWGASRESLYASPRSWFDPVHPADRTKALEITGAGNAECEVEYRIVRSDGEVRWIRERAFPIRNEAGEVYRLAGIAEDVTRRKRAEEALQEACDELEARVERRTADLMAAYKQLEKEGTEREEAREALRAEQLFLRQLLDVHERERQLVAYEIHDGPVQYVTAALMHLEASRQTEAMPPERAKEHYQTALRLLRNTVDEARRLIDGLRPPILDEAGILSAIEYLVRESQKGIPSIEFAHRVQFERLAPPLEVAIFRIVQEALTNAQQHGKAESARIELVESGGRLRLEIRDWGLGFDPDKIGDHHHGIRGIHERAKLFGGKAEIDSAPGDGTRIVVELPVMLPSGGGRHVPCLGKKR